MFHRFNRELWLLIAMKLIFSASSMAALKIVAFWWMAHFKQLTNFQYTLAFIVVLALGVMALYPWVSYLASNDSDSDPDPA